MSIASVEFVRNMNVSVNMVEKLTLDFVKSYIEKEGYVLLDNTYINSVENLNLQCPKGHVFPMSWKVFSNGHRCSYCAGKRQYNIEEVRKILKDFGYTLLSEKYESNRDPLKVLGPDGKEYETTLFSIKIAGVIPHLKGATKQEKDCRAIIEEITGKKFIKVRPSWLVNPNTGKLLELDGYNEELNLAFEYDGGYHFSNKFDGGKEMLEDQYERDVIKQEICEKRGVRLIKIPFYIKDKRSFIYNEIYHADRYLFMGDPHVQKGNLKESKDLISFASDCMKSNNCNNLIISGDLFHTHGLIYVEVMNFWMTTFKKLLKQFRIHVLVGNHDMVLGESEYSGMNNLNIYKNKYKYTLKIADAPYIYRGLGFLSYQENNAEFLNLTNHLIQNGANALVCHQTFNGATFENGFFAPDGVNPKDVRVNTVIAGHIHARQRFGNIIYPGTPRWLTASDANESKGLWLVDFDSQTGTILSEQFLDTSHVCTPIYAYQFKEGDNCPEIPEGSRASVELVGSSEWISKQKVKFKGRASISSKITDKTKPSNRKTGNNLEYFVNSVFEPVTGVKKEQMVKFMKELGVL